MYKSDVVEYYGTQVAVSEILGLTISAISKWDKVIPEKQAMRLEKITDGELEYDSELYG